MMRPLMIAITLMMSGRMMTLAFVHRAGRGGPGDPPIDWLMPLLGDAVVGLSGLLVAWLLARGRGLAVWTLVIVWNGVAIWDAISAFIVSRTSPWPDFFMLQMMGPSMFFIAAAMHGVLIWLVCRPQARQYYLATAPA